MLVSAQLVLRTSTTLQLGHRSVAAICQRFERPIWWASPGGKVYLLKFQQLIIKRLRGSSRESLLVASFSTRTWRLVNQRPLSQIMLRSSPCQLWVELEGFPRGKELLIATRRCLEALIEREVPTSHLKWNYKPNRSLNQLCRKRDGSFRSKVELCWMGVKQFSRETTLILDQARLCRR